MNELPQFDRSVLDALRQPLEDSVVTVSRAAGSITFPAECVLAAAMNPCPCGFKGLPEERRVGQNVCERYGGKISGPLRDRIDIHVEVPPLKPEELLGMAPGECCSLIRSRLVQARLLPHERLGGYRTNAKMTPKDIQETLELDAESKEFMRAVAARMNISARVFDRILKVGRTIADLAASTMVLRTHLAEAAQYRERKEH